MPTTLEPEVRDLLDEAKAMTTSYGVRALLSPGPDPCLVIVLGEAHMKFGPAFELGKRVVDAFDLRGVETFPVREVAAGRALMVLIQWPRLLIRALTLGLLKGSTITYAKRSPSGSTSELETGHRIPLALHAGSVHLAAFFAVSFLAIALGYARPALPAAGRAAAGVAEGLGRVLTSHLALTFLPAYLFRQRPWGWVLCPLMSILSSRDGLMARGTIDIIAKHPGARRLLVIMGRGHLSGYADQLVSKYGYESLEV